MGLQMRPAMARSLDMRPTVNDLQEENRWVALAGTHWLGVSKPRKVRPEVIKNDIWDPLVSEGFTLHSLLLLENLHILEKYLWPTYSENASNYHVLLIAVIVGIKQRENLSSWHHFSDRPADFSNLFRRVLSMNIDYTLPMTSRTYLLSFIINAFQSLENPQMRKECAPLVSIAIWQNLFSAEFRNKILEQSTTLKRAWRVATKRYDLADDSGKARIRFERSWLYSMLLDFLSRLNSKEDEKEDNVRYCERFLEFLVDLESQLPTRRYVNALLKDLNLLPVIRNSRLFKIGKNSLFRDFYNLLGHFVRFPVDDQSGQQLSPQEAYAVHCKELTRLQRIAIGQFKNTLTLLALANFGAIGRRSELETHLLGLNDTELLSFCFALGFRTTYPEHTKIVADRSLLLEIILSAFEYHPSIQKIASDLTVFPNETSLYDQALVRSETFDGSRPLSVPKLNLQYLTLGDFLCRSLSLYRAESFFEIKSDLESIIKRMQPRVTRETQEIKFEGFSRMAIPISKPAIIEVAPAKVGSIQPGHVRAEILLDVSRLNDGVRQEWESLRPDDVVFLLAVGPINQPFSLDLHPAAKLGDVEILRVRCAEVVQILDANGRALRESQNTQQNNYSRSRPFQRRLLVNLDASAYKADLNQLETKQPDIYMSINVLVRRKSRENNFKSILETIRSLAITDTKLPSWLEEVFLGYGDPRSASYPEMGAKLKSVDFRDTFLHWQHLKDSFPGHVVEPKEHGSSPFGPPYVLEMSDCQPTAEALNPPKKRRRNHDESVQPARSLIRASTYKPINQGPYPMDTPKVNKIRFTPAQVNAIVSGTQPGLTVIVGPPGTGKTDVATQIISNLYHNFANERTLLIAHSNQALNQLFQKIIALDIDERHLLRLGRGEEDLESDVSYSKFGRVESFLENRAGLLAEVGRLASSIGAEGAHGNSCETAGYFNTVYTQPAWAKFWDKANAATSPDAIIQAFPFHSFFSNAPQPLFRSNASLEEIWEIAAGCQRHIDKLFSELEDIRPFEILRQQRDRANYLLVKEARIIAMTSTHAAMRREEIAKLGFQYDNVIMEEAAQITEIESVIPCALQNTKRGELPLKRVVLCGDHLQNSPIIQNIAFRQYANFEQSLFLRLVRLGVPTINLDQQGRARPSIAELFKWRYDSLGNLSTVETTKEFKTANAGFRYDYQFINVPSYQGAGEREPSPHFIQNLGEAEYAVAIFQYMRLLGYASSKISILTTYAGQKALIKDVLSHRCAKNSLFGLPKIVTTVDKYQGEQNDYIILSLTRTKTVGYLRDVRRLTVALSRARLGLYILGRREVFQSCFELKPAFDILSQRPDKLMLLPGEMFPTDRALDAEIDGTPMEGIEHMGQYVYEMTQAMVKAMGQDVAVLHATPIDDSDQGPGEDDYENDAARETLLE